MEGTEMEEGGYSEAGYYVVFITFCVISLDSSVCDHHQNLCIGKFRP